MFVVLSALSSTDPVEQYSLKRSHFVMQPDKAQEIVSDIDSRLNSFIDSLPAHRESPLPLLPALLTPRSQ